MEQPYTAPPPPPPGGGHDYPLTFSVDYPDRELSRLTSFFRLFTAIPIGIVLVFVAGARGAGGFLFLPPLLMLLFRKKYPVWWANWNRELLRFENRVSAYLGLMSDQYPSTDEEQFVHLDFPTPDGQQLSRGMPLIKWLLAIPHYIVLFFLAIAAIVAVVIAWFAILFTARYPRGLFDFVEGVLRWSNRVHAYAWILITDRYPPFSLKP